MSIDPGRLQDVLELFGVTLERSMQPSDLAELLGSIEELLPWLCLRANAFADHDAIQHAIETAAKRAPGVETTREPAVTASPLQYRASRAIDAAMEALIADNIERRQLALAVDAELAKLVRLSVAEGPIRPETYVRSD